VHESLVCFAVEYMILSILIIYHIHLNMPATLAADACG
jgi:hypothetical protein